MVTSVSVVNLMRCNRCFCLQVQYNMLACSGFFHLEIQTWGLNYTHIPGISNSLLQPLQIPSDSFILLYRIEELLDFSIHSSVKLIALLFFQHNARAGLFADVFVRPPPFVVAE